MELKCVIAVLRPDFLKVLERRLAALHIHGMTVTRARGFGVHPNPFANDWTTEHIKIEIFTVAENVDALAKEIMDVANEQSGGDGVVAVVPVERFWRVRRAAESAP
ncbi:transcriptional regulator [Burkholderia ubonensis]|uniref:Transcriptional regulator n=1 Tax=Burkholderia ubonensis TaxID=101571 RepID=A0AB73GAP3_9BURK|nr:P-II family nitrogen regulator [Burkholderia ubonensis]KVK86562.1 transcriptional regulator [Burkholderia ubonensis]KVL71310.1 transcriptional regulator [Burkholderia ubonensis]KVM35995.1 transcriptional regulator [Burkholderia ubonensis]KVM40064.1 transcriptional regulator [Burkholderia ubonensis]